MIKLCFTLIIGTFIIYGLDEMKLISTADFKHIEEPAPKEEIFNTHSATKAVTTSKFTDRIVNKRKQQQEG